MPFPTISPLLLANLTATTPEPLVENSTTPTTTTTKIIGCGEVPKIANGFVYLASSETRRPGDWVTYECNQGFRMTGKFIVKCLENGTWEQLPSCTKDGQAPPPQTLPGGIDPATADLEGPEAGMDENDLGNLSIANYSISLEYFHINGFN